MANLRGGTPDGKNLAVAPVDSAGGPPVIPDGLAARVRREGQEGWLNELPDLIVELAERWGLQLETPFSRGPTVSWVAPAGKVDGVRAVLKVGMPHREARTEIAVRRAEVLRPGRPGLLDLVAEVNGRLAHIVVGLRRSDDEPHFLRAGDDF